MSTELQELIYRTSMIAMAQGERKAETRILKMLEEEQLECITVQNEEQHKFAHLVFEGVKEQLLALIKGENK